MMSRRHLRTLAVAAVLGILAASGASAADAATSSPRGGTLRISYLPVDLAKSPFEFPANVQDWPARLFPPIHVFGRDYQGKVEAALTFDMLRIGTPVIAGFDGTVVRVTEQPESCDSEVYIEMGDPVNHASYDHIIPSVKVGQSVRAGQVIGKVGPWQCTSTYGGVELMVVSQTSGGVVATCPMTLLAPDRAAAIGRQVRATMRAWNAHAAGAASVYSAKDLARGLCATRTTSAR